SVEQGAKEGKGEEAKYGDAGDHKKLGKTTAAKGATTAEEVKTAAKLTK
ncbi:MAG: hypothetical protein HQL28_07155, partial [Candidatus Omnitrophica bacterium]|nr:hypothetical protein [Candidatus Omnitrophota bacterium]